LSFAGGGPGTVGEPRLFKLKLNGVFIQTGGRCN
jgi:hypothetical protein